MGRSWPPAGQRLADRRSVTGRTRTSPSPATSASTTISGAKGSGTPVSRLVALTGRTQGSGGPPDRREAAVAGAPDPPPPLASRPDARPYRPPENRGSNQKNEDQPEALTGTSSFVPGHPWRARPVLNGRYLQAASHNGVSRLLNSRMSRTREPHS